MFADDHQPNQHGTDQHDDSYIQTGVKCLVSCGSANKA